LLASHCGKQLNRRMSMRTFDDALPADAARQIRNLKRRLRYQYRLDRPKVWPGDVRTSIGWFYRQPEGVVDQWLATLLQPPSAEAYISSWCRLNHLIET